MSTIDIIIIILSMNTVLKIKKVEVEWYCMFKNTRKLDHRGLLPLSPYLHVLPPLLAWVNVNPNMDK